MTEYEKALQFTNIHRASFSASFSDRRAYVKKYSWAIPSQKVIDLIAQMGDILEVGSGNGYWAFEIIKAQKKFSIESSYIATDIGGDDGHFQMFETFWHKPDYFMDAVDAIKQFGENRSLLMCWPSYDIDWSSRALDQYMKQGGKRLIYIGEGQYGCTGDDKFHELRYNDYWKKSQFIDIPCWDGIQDCLFIHERKE